MAKIIYIFLLCTFYTMTVFSQQSVVTKKDGKYGLFDKNHGVVLPPECDTIISEKDWSGMLFILKKNDKYAYAYFRNLDSLGKFGYLTPHWEIGKFDYDELVPIDRSATLRYKKNDKYGLIDIRMRLYCETGFWTICWFDGLGEQNSTDAIYDEPFRYNNDRILNVKKNNQWHLFQPFEGKEMEWINYSYNDVFDSIALYPDDHKIAEEYYRSVKKDGKWGLIKIKPETKSIEYIIPYKSITYKTIRANYSNEVFYTEKADNDTIYINDTKNNIQYNLNIPTLGDLEVHVLVLEYYSNNIVSVKQNKNSCMMVGLRHYTPAYIYKEITIIDTNGAIKATYNDINAVYLLHENPWGTLISKKITDGKQSIHDFFDLETGKKKFTIKTSSNVIISSCEKETPILPLVSIENGKKKMIGYYDFLTKKYYKKPPKKDERCYGF